MMMLNCQVFLWGTQGTEEVLRLGIEIRYENIAVLLPLFFIRLFATKKKNKIKL